MRSPVRNPCRRALEEELRIALDCTSAAPDPTNTHSTVAAAKRRVIALNMAKAPLP
jgi:hypothetical protein